MAKNDKTPDGRGRPKNRLYWQMMRIMYNTCNRYAPSGCYPPYSAVLTAVRQNERDMDRPVPSSRDLWRASVYLDHEGYVTFTPRAHGHRAPRKIVSVDIDGLKCAWDAHLVDLIAREDARVRAREAHHARNSAKTVVVENTNQHH